MRNTGYILLLVILVSLQGCFATKKRCLRWYQPITSTDTVVVETIRDSIVYKDTTIIVELPGETIIDSIIIEVPGESVPAGIPSDTIRLETEYARAEAFYVAPRLYLVLEQKQSVLEVKLDSALRESYKWESLYTEILNKEVVQVKHVPLIYKVSLYLWGGVLAILILLFIAHRLKLW